MFKLNRNLWYLFTLNLATAFANQIIQPLFPLFLRSISATDVEIGLVISISGFAAMLMMLPSGFLMDWVGKKRMLTLSVILGAIPPIFIAMMKNWVTVTPFFMLFNLSFSFFAPARMAMIAETATDSNRATIFGLMNISWPIGGVMGPALSGYIVDNFGWKIPFLISTGIMAISLAPTLMLKEPNAFPLEKSRVTRKFSLPDRQYFPTIALFFSFHLIMTTGLGGVNTILPIFLKDRLMLSNSLIGFFFTGASILTLITQIPSGWLADRYSRKKLIIILIIWIPAFFIAWTQIENWFILLALYTVAFSLWSMTWPASLALLSDSIPMHMQGSGFGIRMTGVRLGFTIGPLISSYLYSNVNHKFPFSFSAMIFAAGVILSLFLKEHSKEDK